VFAKSVFPSLVAADLALASQQDLLPRPWIDETDSALIL
jgi:hypothetical protein